MAVNASPLKNSIIRYGAAVLLVAVASAAREAIVWSVGQDLPTYVTFYPAVMVAAILCGMRAGIVATVLSTLVVDYWFITPGRFFAYNDAAEVVGQGMFLALGIFVSIMAWQYRRTSALYREQKLRQQEESKFRQMANSIPQLAWIARPDGHIFWYNDRWYEYTGATPDEMEGWGWQKVHDPRLLPEIMERWKESLSTGRPFDMTFPLRGGNGKFRQFLTRVMPVRDSDGNILQWFGTNTDITNQLDMQEELRQSEERFRLLFEQAAVGIKRVGPDGRLLEVNDKFCDIMGYSRQELLSMSLSDFTHAEDLPLEQKLIADLLSGAVADYTIEKRCIRKDKQIIWGRVSSSLPLGGGGPAQWFISVFEDITARKQAQEALSRTAEELTRSNHDLEQFAYVSSHDLQEPLRMVTGFMQLFEEKYRDKLDETGRKYISFAVDGSRRMQQLIDDLLAYSRVGSRGSRPERVESESRLKEALANLQISIGESSAKITYGKLPAVIADGRQLTQVFQNLISNAIKFRGGTAPQIHVDASRDDRSWIFSVKDNGIGISPQFVDKIFVIFQRLHSRDKYPGTGIGLAICKKIVERHGGRIWVESAEGKGATFYFTLPDQG